MTPPADNAPTLPIPTARDIRIRLTPLAAVKSNYYGTPTPPDGLVTDYVMRKEAASEANLFPVVPAQPAARLLAAAGRRSGGAGGAILWPDRDRADIVRRARHPHRLRRLGRAALHAVARPQHADFRQRRRALGPLDRGIDDRSGARLDMGRLRRPGAQRDRATAPRSARWCFRPSSAPTRSAPRPSGGPHHDAARLSRCDQPAIRRRAAFPKVLNPAYAVTASFPAAPAIHQSWTTLRLPITTNPAQTPKVVSTGIAESPYVGGLRLFQHRVARPLSLGRVRRADRRHRGRQLFRPGARLRPGSALGRRAAAARACARITVPEPPLAIDAETVRVVFAGEDADESGLDAMTPLIRASATTSGPDGVHFLLPLPPGIAPDALDLFGFWTYEFRVGHAEKWSTAQGRFGRPLRVAGVQHPAPRLTCTVGRNNDRASPSRRPSPRRCSTDSRRSIGATAIRRRRSGSCSIRK